MRLHNFLIIAVGIGVFSYPALHGLPTGPPLMLAREEVQQPQPRPDPSRTEFAMRIEINVPATMLTLYGGDEVLLEAPVAVGSIEYRTPIQTDHLNSIIWNPWWIPPDSEWARDEKPTPPGPKNPLGPVKLLLGNGIRIHGTNKPSSIATPASHGCIRMFSEDAVALAWYLQTRLTNKSDASWLERYRANSNRSYYVRLDKPVDVEFVYTLVTLKDDVITIHPDIYKKVRNLRSVVEWTLFASGLSPWALDLQALPTNASRVQRLHVQTLAMDNNQRLQP